MFSIGCRRPVHSTQIAIGTTLTLLLGCASAASAPQPTYFLLDGNPASVKYVSGALQRLPVQDGDELNDLLALEAVSAIVHTTQPMALLPEGATDVHLGEPQVPSYGQPMFDVTRVGTASRMPRTATLVWTGPRRFIAVPLELHALEARLRRKLIDDSRRTIIPMLDYRHDPAVGRRLNAAAPPYVRNYGRVAGAPHLTFVDVTWKVRHVPDVLTKRSIGSLLPFLSVQYVVDTRSAKLIYRNVSNQGGIEDRVMRLFQESGGPLLMAVEVACLDGGEPLILDLDHETYGTDRPDNVAPSLHCFPAQ